MVLLSRFTGCEFAARSGGHAAFTGASSSPGGISIWFKDMNEVSLKKDKSVASIGPGNTWLSVYSALEPYGLAAVGGRVSSIGVGGFVLGGGISYHSNLYGWACDNVESFEVAFYWRSDSRASCYSQTIGRYCQWSDRHCKRNFLL